MSETPASPPPTAPPEESPTQPLSKNAQKKLARAARLAEQKKERRAHEKEKKKEKKRLLAAKRDAGELDADEEGPRKKARTEGPKTPFEARVVVDLGFDDMMSENEIKSLTSQLAFTYAANRKASRPFSTILFTSLNGRTFTRLEEIGNAAYKRWTDTEWWQEGYEKLWEGQDSEGNENTPQDGAVAGDGEKAVENATETQKITSKLSMQPQRASQGTVVYLTADTADELAELKEGETYIIGGICDHNRYKKLCFNKAQGHNIRTARLPIGTYLADMKTRKVLTVNQTFEILLKWVETKDWKEAFEAVIPKRKFNEKSKDARRAGSGAAGEQRQDAEKPAQVVVIDAAALEDEEMGGEVEVEVDADADADGDDDGDVETAGGEFGTLVASTEEPDVSTKNGPATILDDSAHAEIPS